MAASGKLNLILVDCDWGKKHSDVSGKYGVRGYPTVIFVDSDGKEVAKLGGREADAVAKQFEDVAAQYSKAAAFVESWDDASAQAKEAGKTVVLFFSNGKADAEALEAAIGDDLLKDLQEKFVWCKVKLDSKSDLCKKFKVSGSSQSVLMVVDPSVEKPEDKPLKKWSGKKSAKELKKDLEAILKKLEDGK